MIFPGTVCDNAEWSSLAVQTRLLEEPPFCVCGYQPLRVAHAVRLTVAPSPGVVVVASPIVVPIPVGPFSDVVHPRPCSAVPVRSACHLACLVVLSVCFVFLCFLQVGCCSNLLIYI